MPRLKVLVVLLLCVSVLCCLLAFHSTTLFSRKDYSVKKDHLLSKVTSVLANITNKTTTAGQETSTAEIRKRQYARRGKVQSVCRENGLENPARRLKDIEPSDFSRIFVDDHYKILYCEVPKVACTNWKKILLILTGKMNTSRPEQLSGALVHTDYQKKYLRTLDTYEPKQILKKIHNYYKFMFVREPLERIVSAFRDKFAQKSSTTYQQRIGSKIIKRYRPNASKQSLDSGSDVTFEEFVRFLLDLRNQQAFDPHWRPYYKLCHPCLVQYDFVGQYSTMAEDVDYVLQELGVEHLINFPKGLRGSKTSAHTGMLFGNITDEQIHSLWKLYSVDYAMFGYAYPDFNQPK